MGKSPKPADDGRETVATTMTQKRADHRRGIEYYADDPSVGALTLLNHPVLHAVRVRNHMWAEGIESGGR